MTTSKRDIYTEYGETTIETVECASCRMEVPRTNARPWFIGVIDHEFGEGTGHIVKFESGYDRGYACDDCREGSIVTVPAAVRFEQPALWLILTLTLATGLIIGVYLL